MVTMEGSPSPASRTPSPVLSVSSADGARARRAAQAAAAARANTVPCEWEGCARAFADIRGLVEHLDSEHISAHRPSYTCEWATCARRGVLQASRFALVSHCRSHTGERPFICPSPDCDKSFTRSDTLAKHMRQKHNISPPAPGRGGHRKRKRSPTPAYVHQPFAAPDRDRAPSPPPDGAPSHYNFANRTYAQHPDGRDSGFNTFRVNPPPVAPPSAPPRAPEHPARAPYDPRADESTASSDDDAAAAAAHNPALAGGRSRAMVRYLIMKAKYRYVLQEQGMLSDELQALKRQEKDEWHEKEAGVDRVLRVLGPQSDQLIHDSEAPANGKRPHQHPHPHAHPLHEDAAHHHEHRMDVDAR